MRRALTILIASAYLAGCSGGVPSFLGREGSGNSAYTFGGDSAPVDPISIPYQTAKIDWALNGLLLTVSGITPTQGYHTAQLVLLRDGDPDGSGILDLEFYAYAPTGSENIGPEATREIRAAVFFPTRYLKNLRGFRITGGGQSRVLNVPGAR